MPVGNLVRIHPPIEGDNKERYGEPFVSDVFGRQGGTHRMLLLSLRPDNWLIDIIELLPKEVSVAEARVLTWSALA